MTTSCNLCGCSEWGDMGVRQGVLCRDCNSVERTRLLWLYLQQLGVDRTTRILHLAPEKGIYQQLSAITSEKNYVTADFDPNRYRFATNCRPIDLCNLDGEPSRQFDLILHSHVLEHIPCSIAYVLFHLHRMLTDDGTHLFIAPFMPGRYDECFAELSDEERIARFGQFDHVRRFGRDDIGSHIGQLLRLPDQFDATVDFPPETLRRYNIPEGQWTGFHPGTVLRLRRHDMHLLAHDDRTATPSGVRAVAERALSHLPPDRAQSTRTLLRTGNKAARKLRRKGRKLLARGRKVIAARTTGRR